MMRKPNNITLFIVIGLLFCYLSFDFIADAKQDFFILNYDWEHFKSRPIGEVRIIDYQVNILKIKLDKYYPFNNQKTYVIDNEHYFRAEKIEINDGKVNFIGVYWINEYPRNLEGTMHMSEGDLTLLQQTGTKVAMIGDSQMGWREGKYTRKWIAEKLKVHFIGDQYDVFGYPYFLSNNYNSLSILQDSLNYSDAEVIILYLDLRENAETFSRNIRKFSSLNKEKKIILIHQFSDEKTLEKTINRDDSKNVHFINITRYDKNKYFFSDQKHLNYAGHKKLVKKLISKLKSIGISEN